MDYERKAKDMQLKVEAVQTTSEKGALEQSDTISALRDDLSIERAKREALEKIVAQADKYRTDDKQQMIHATAENAESQAKEVEALRRKVVEVEDNSSREHELAIAGIRENIKALTERVDSLSGAAVEARTYDTSKPRNRSQLTSKSADCHSVETHAEKSKFAAREVVQVESIEDLPTARIGNPHDPVHAAGLYEILERLSKLETFAMPESKHQSADVATILGNLNHLNSRVDTLLECRDIAKLTSIDVDILKRQQADHVIDCEAKHYDQSETMKTLIDFMRGQLQKRIDHNFDLHSGLHRGHHWTGSRRLMETQRSMRAFRDSGDGGSISRRPKGTVTEERFVSLEARVNKLITANEMYNLRDLPSRLVEWTSSLCSDLDECKKGVAEDMRTLLALINALQAQREKQRDEIEDLSTQFKNVLRQIPYSSS